VVQTLHDFEMISSSPIDARGGWWDPDETRLRFKALNSLTRPVHRLLHAPRISAFVAVSRFVARVHATRGIDARVVPNFVGYTDHELADPPAFEERIGIVFLGRLRPEKGVLDVVEMAERIPDIPVTIVGSGDLEQRIRADAERIPNLHVAGFVPDPALREILRGARAVVIPSRCQDAGPLVPLEAMAHATPVVAYAVGGLGEYVVDAGGRVVPIDVPALASAAREIHEHRATWEQLSRSGLEAIAARHTSSTYAERLEETYDEVVSRVRMA
jgi:glycosyltransferase involved in cell wall biosynthesis